MKGPYWTSRRTRRFSIGILCAVFVAILFGYGLNTPPVASAQFAAIRLGDFPAFYTAAVIVREGLGKKLYDFNLQCEIQSRYLLKNTGGCILFPYPPYDAFFLMPLARLPIGPAKWIFTGILFFFLCLSVVIASRYAPIFGRNWLATAAFFLAFCPVLTAVLGGQNTSLSMLLYSGALWGISRRTKKGDWICGLCLGLWLFKPHYGLIVIFFFMFSKSRRILAGAFLVAVAYYWIGAMVSGFLWPVEWLDKIRNFQEGNLRRDAGQMISFLGTAKAAQIVLGIDENRAWIFHGLGYGASLAVFVWLALRFRAVGHLPENTRKNDALQNLLELTGPALLLIAPQSLFYDFGICVFSCARHVRLNRDRIVMIFIGLVLLVSLCAAFRDRFPVQPLFFGTLVLIHWLSRTQRASVAAPPCLGNKA